MGEKIQVRRGLSSVRVTKVLDSGEPGFDTDTKQFFVGDGTTLGGIPVTPSMAGYIDGLVLQWNSASSLTVTSGSAYVPSVGRIISLVSPITLSGLSLPASAFSHVYIDGSATQPGIIISSNAPSAPYNGTARVMSGDSSKRYIGSILTDANSSIWNFVITNGTLYYKGFLNQSPFTVLSGGMATAETNVSLSGAVPITAQVAFIRHTDPAATQSNTRLNNGSATFPNYALNFASGTDAFINFPMKSDQSVSYWFGSTPVSSGCSIQILGYVLER